jgi:glycosyltransferase involved in cell wall biosynthesis
MRLGIIARSDNTGLGNQTRELVNMLNPDKILLIDSFFFNKNPQHPDWYEGYNVLKTAQGMPNSKEIGRFLEDIDVVISCETFYDANFIKMARKQGVKTILQYNYELFGNMADPTMDLPDILLAPSLWNIDIVQDKFGHKTKVIHLPPPTDVNLFNSAREVNMGKTHKRILHIGGRKAARDRNGTESVIGMLKYCKEDYELVVRTQTPLDFGRRDNRLTIETGNPDNREDLYSGYDAMLLPRRYAGLCLPMNEALMSGLPVFMTNVSPNNLILPEEWLLRSEKTDSFRTKAMVDVYSASPREMARAIDAYVKSKDKIEDKKKALEIGIKHFSVDNLKQKYLDLLA